MNIMIENKETNCKDWAIDKTTEIKEICKDLKYIQNNYLLEQGLDRISYLASRVLEHLEYLDIKDLISEEDTND